VGVVVGFGEWSGEVDVVGEVEGGGLGSEVGVSIGVMRG